MEWISVEDRWPDLHEPILLKLTIQRPPDWEDIEIQVTGEFDNDDTGYMWRLGNSYLAWDHHFNLSVEYGDITHWMPLPPPPKE